VLLQHRVEHLGDGALLGGGKLADLFELLLDLRRRPAFAAASPGRRADQVFDAGVEGLGQQRQHGNRHTHPAGSGDGFSGTLRYVDRELMKDDHGDFGQAYRNAAYSSVF
jgi:hypothetical protein